MFFNPFNTFTNMKMKKFLFAFVAILLSVGSFANPLPNPSQDGPNCSVDAPCYYTGSTMCYENKDNPKCIGAPNWHIKVVKVQGQFIAIITSRGNSYGESHVVYEHRYGKYTHYFLKDGERFYFTM